MNLSTDRNRRFADQKTVSEVFGLSIAWLERDRWSGAFGLPFYKVNGKVLYDMDEVEQKIKAQRRTSTSDPAEG